MNSVQPSFRLIYGLENTGQCENTKEDPRSRWAKALLQRRHKNVAAVAMANKMVRTAYALLKYIGIATLRSSTLAKSKH